MLLRQLTYFASAAEFGSFSAAAEALHVSQPAVTVQIEKLEDELSTQLFYRDHSGVHLTAAGGAFLADIKDILARLELAVGRVATKSGKSRVRLGIIPQLSRVLLTPLVEEFARRHPAINLVVKEGMGAELARWVEEGELDFALTNRNTKSRPLRVEPIIAQEFHLIGHRDSVQHDGKPIRFAELGAYPLIQGAMDGSRVREKALERLAAARKMKLDFGFESPITVRKEMLRILGRSTVSFSALFQEEIAIGEFCARPIRDPTLIQTLYLVTRRTRARNAAESVAGNLVKAQINHMIRQGLYGWHSPGWSANRNAVEL